MVDGNNMPANNGVRCKIAAISHALPQRVMTNQDIISTYGLRLNPEWVRLNIGISERRWCEDDETTADLAARVLTDLIAQGNANSTPPAPIDGMVLATVSAEMMTPATASRVQAMVSPGQTYPCFDITAACSGFLYALDIGRRYIQTGASHFICLAAEVRSRALDKQDRRTVMLFGDGAAGVSLTPCTNDEVGIFYSKTKGDGRFWDAISVPVGGTIQMKEATLIFETAIAEMAALIQEALAEAGLALEQIGQFIFHQASGVIVDKVAQELGLPEERYYKNFSVRGNTTSASVAIALSEAVTARRIRKHDLVCLIATGGGFSAGITLLRWELD